ncbi:MAG TPA: inorganic phosphate transporter [Vicinamibacterales bacterium]|nr:inorganic phosphate transporter [Vicinamibacterales bacterium]
MTIALLTIIAAAAVAYANGANDVSKGVGTLIGSRLASYAHGLRWGTLWTVLGANAALMLSTTMLKTFSTGLVSGALGHAAAFPLAVAIGAFVWVLIAVRTGLPVSTTHSITGAIIGAAAAAGGTEGVRWTLVLKAVALPLAFSPIAAALIAYGLHAMISRRLAAASRYCLCARQNAVILPDPQAGGVTAARALLLPIVVVDEHRACSDGATVAGVRLTDGAHWLTSAALSFARGLNDTSKIVALAVGAAVVVGVNAPSMYVVGAIVMGAGSLLYGQRVTRTLAEHVTDIDPLEGLAASAVAAGLVLAASAVALPVSTTHVASGAIIGVGLRSGTRAIQWRTVRDMVAAWIVTLPASALAAALAWVIFSR